MKVAEFVMLEKLCCPFLHFIIEVAAEGGLVTLRLTGREGGKAFVREEISGFVGNVIDWDAIDWNRGRMRMAASENTSEKGSEKTSEKGSEKTSEKGSEKTSEKGCE